MLHGLLGHTTMYHDRMQSFYVYGGISYTREVSNNLFVLHFPTRRWSKVPINNGRNVPYPRALHAAVATDSYMVIYGGMANQGNVHKCANCMRNNVP